MFWRKEDKVLLAFSNSFLTSVLSKLCVKFCKRLTGCCWESNVWEEEEEESDSFEYSSSEDSKSEDSSSEEMSGWWWDVLFFQDL